MLFNCYKKDGSKEKISSIAAQKYVVVIARTKMLNFVFGKIICTRDICNQQYSVVGLQKKAINVQSNFISMRLQKEGHNNIGKVMIMSILAKPKQTCQE
jgi:hypothetical protein